MGYLHIDNLYKNQDILLFRECYALEKVHGTSAHVRFNKTLTFFSGGAKHETFKTLFDADALTKALEVHDDEIVIYGEAYGGKEQGMRETYGSELRFIVFDVQIGKCWLDVPRMAEFAKNLGFEVVPYWRTSTDLAALNALRDQPSVVGELRGCPGRPSEGIVLRPLIELTKNNGERVIAKHKGDAFSERKNTPKVDAPERLKVLADAKAIAEEWVTPMRLVHVLDKLPQGIGVEATRTVIDAMVADVIREAAGEIVLSPEAISQIGRVTAVMFKRKLQAALSA